jgi:hypothetical protein
MAKQPRKTRYSSSNCIQDIVGFICSYFLSYHDPGPEYIVEIQDDHFQPEEPQEIKPQIVDYVHIHTPVHIPDASVESLVRHKPPALSPTLAKPLDGCKPLASSPVLAKIPDRYKPLDLPPILHDLPVNYINNLPRFDGENANITAEKHIQNLEDFLDLYEVEDDDVCIRMFALSLGGKVKDWFKNLPAASIRNFQQFMQVFLDRWVVMRNVFLLLEEYDHLKRKPGETIHQFSARFNKVYHAIPTDIRPPPGSAHLHYPDAFDPEMTFQLRERNTTSLEEMQSIAVDVETNLLIKRSKLKDKEMEQLKSSEAKLEILVSAMEEMMQRINRKDELAVQRHHVPLISEKEKVFVSKRFAAHPWYHGLDNNSFMYSIHNTDKDEAPSRLVEEQPADMICMFNGISSVDDLPKCNQYEDDHKAEIEVVCSEQSTACHWQEEDHLQFRCDNQPLHNSHDSDEEETENLRVSEDTLPLCFSSFQFLKRNSRSVVNSEDRNSSDQSIDDAIKDMEAVLNPESQHLPCFDFQISDERLKPEANSELIQNNSGPLCFNSFQILKETLGQVLKDKYIKGQEVSFKSMQQSGQSFQDPIADRLDGLCGQNHSPSSSYGIKRCYDMDMLGQSATGVCSVEASFHKPSEHPQSYEEVLKDTECIAEKSSLDAELFEVENQKMGQTYTDPVATYMEKFFNTGYFSVADVFPIVWVDQILCKGKQGGNYSQARVTDLFLSFITDSERTEPLNQLLDWLHWHFSIT